MNKQPKDSLHLRYKYMYLFIRLSQPFLFMTLFLQRHWVIKCSLNKQIATALLTDAGAFFFGLSSVNIQYNIRIIYD